MSFVLLVAVSAALSVTAPLSISPDAASARLLPSESFAAATGDAPDSRPTLVKAKWVVLGVALALFAGAGALVSYAVIRQPEGTFSQVLTAVSGSVGTISLFAISGLLYAIAHDREPQQVLFTVLLAMTSGVLIGAATGPLLSIPTALRIPVTVTSVVITNAFFIPLAIWVW